MTETRVHAKSGMLSMVTQIVPPYHPSARMFLELPTPITEVNLG